MPELSARRAALLAIACAVALLALVFVAELLPRLTKSTRAITSTPVPTGMRNAAAVPLDPGQTACMDGITLTPDGARLELAIDQARPLPTPPLEVTLRAPGYVERAQVPAAGEHALTVAIEPPPRTVTGAVCVRNRGDAATVLSATADPRVLTRTRASVDGAHPLAAAFVLTFTEGGTSTPLSRLGATVTRAATFNALGPWAVWLIAALVAIAVPLLLLRAFYVAVRAEEPGADDGGPAS